MNHVRLCQILQSNAAIGGLKSLTVLHRPSAFLLLFQVNMTDLLFSVEVFESLTFFVQYLLSSLLVEQLLKN